jgi:hypothetical protein
MKTIHKYLPWLLALFVALGVFIPSLFFKFSGAAESRHIFETVGNWLGFRLFEPYGRILIGAAELVASVLLLIPSTQALGAILGLGVMSGAIFFHLVTPLQVTVRWMENGIPHEDASLFVLAVISWLSCLIIIWMRRERLPFIGLKPVKPLCAGVEECR